MSGLGSARRRLVERARHELPEPSDPRRLIEDLAASGVDGPEVFEVLSRSSLAWTQLRDLRLEASWQSGWGWFLARNLMLFGVVVLVLTLALQVPLPAVEGALTGAGLYYLIIMAMAPLRLRRHKHRRAGILTAYAADLGAYLDELERR